MQFSAKLGGTVKEVGDNKVTKSQNSTPSMSYPCMYEPFIVHGLVPTRSSGKVVVLFIVSQHSIVVPYHTN